jgi:prevent-host-death family protein
MERPMKTRFSQDIIPLSVLKINPGKIANQAKDSHRPILLTSRGRGIAVMQGLEEFENHEEERAFVKAIAQGLLEVKEGNVQNLADAKKKLGINT